MKAVVLAGGYGSRVMPLSHYRAKPMLPVANRPVIDYAVGRLNAAGIRDISFALGYRPGDIMEYISGYVDIRPSFVCDEIPLGTAGSVKRAAAGMSGEIVVLSADTICGSDISALVRRHRESGAAVTVETAEAEDLGAFGAVRSEGGFMTEICEKCAGLKGRRGVANAGTYVVDSRVLSYVPDGVPFDFARDLFPLLLSLGERIAVCPCGGYWKDIGSLRDYYDANFEAAEMYFPSARHIRRVWNCRRGGSLIAETAVVRGTVKDCVIGDGAVVADSARLEKCVVLPGEFADASACGEIVGGKFELSPMLGNVNLQNSENPTEIFRLFASIEL